MLFALAVITRRCLLRRRRAKYFLAGIQFMLGDLEATTTPGAKLSR